ncbi:MAG: ABC transporter ATP-binding protein [Burkholderiales bacterium]
MLEIRSLSASYGAIAALTDVDLSVPEGAVVALLGANGAGKTTLMRAITGDARLKSTGSIRFQGNEMLGSRTEATIRAGIALVPEGRKLFPELSVNENLAMGAYLRRDKAGIAEDLQTVRALFPRLSERGTQLAATLSGGEQQMVAIGRGLMSRPKLLLLDEPSLGLAPVLVEEIIAMIGRIAARGVTILLVEQNARQALTVSTHAHVLEKGRIVASGLAADIASDPKVFNAYFG